MVGGATKKFNPRGCGEQLSAISTFSRQAHFVRGRRPKRPKPAGWRRYQCLIAPFDQESVELAARRSHIGDPGRSTRDITGREARQGAKLGASRHISKQIPPLVETDQKDGCRSYFCVSTETKADVHDSTDKLFFRSITFLFPPRFPGGAAALSGRGGSGSFLSRKPPSKPACHRGQEQAQSLSQSTHHHPAS